MRLVLAIPLLFGPLNPIHSQEAPVPHRVAPGFSLSFVQAPKPDYDKDVLEPLHEAQRQALAKAKAACDAQNGTLSGLQCVLPPPPDPTPIQSVSVVPAGSGDAKSFIYEHESGNRTDAVNASSGACGLGQALPCSKMPCSLQDYACQDNFFTNYMLARYGTWENARAFWQVHSWW